MLGTIYPKTSHAAPMELKFFFETCAINIPLLTELSICYYSGSSFSDSVISY